MISTNKYDETTSGESGRFPFSGELVKLALTSEVKSYEKIPLGTPESSGLFSLVYTVLQDTKHR